MSVSQEASLSSVKVHKQRAVAWRKSESGTSPLSTPETTGGLIYKAEACQHAVFPGPNHPYSRVGGNIEMPASFSTPPRIVRSE